MKMSRKLVAQKKGNVIHFRADRRVEAILKQLNHIRFGKNRSEIIRKCIFYTFNNKFCDTNTKNVSRRKRPPKPSF